MNSKAPRRLLLPLTFIVVVCVALSLLWSVPYIFTLLGLSAWAFFGHLITADDDFPEGWSNPDGKQPFPWLELGTKGAVLVLLGLAAVAFPALRSFGGNP
jgi:hypothetical protein